MVDNMVDTLDARRMVTLVNVVQHIARSGGSSQKIGFVHLTTSDTVRPDARGFCHDVAGRKVMQECSRCGHGDRLQHVAG